MRGLGRFLWAIITLPFLLVVGSVGAVILFGIWLCDEIVEGFKNDD